MDQDGGAGPAFCARGDAPAIGVDDLFHHGETEPAALGDVTIAVQPFVALQDALELRSTEAWTGIVHLDAVAVPLPTERDENASLSRILDRIGHEIGDEAHER